MGKPTSTNRAARPENDAVLYPAKCDLLQMPLAIDGQESGMLLAHMCLKRMEKGPTCFECTIDHALIFTSCALVGRRPADDPQYGNARRNAASTWFTQIAPAIVR